MEERGDIYTDAQIEAIESTEWDFFGEETQGHLHSLHPYPARMIPQIPRKAILRWTGEGDLILDPFAGCGTALLEATLSGRDSIGVDCNPVACLISRAKTVRYEQEELYALRQFLGCLDEMFLDERLKPCIPSYPNMEYWFDKEAVNELGRLKACVNMLAGNAKTLALCCLSAIIVSVSYQAGDTKYARKETEYLPGLAFRKYKAKLKSALENAETVNGQKTGESSVYSLDGRKLHGISEDSVTLIVTSPPYLNAYDYHKYHRHRMHWIDGDVAFARDSEIGKHDTFTRKGATPDRYFSDMERCFQEWQRVLKKDGHCLIVIGDAIVSGRPVAVADAFLDLLQKTGMHFQKRWIRHLDVNKKSFNQKSRIKKEHILLLKK